MATRNNRSASSQDLDTEQTDTEVIIRIADRRWRIRGLEKQLSYDRLKVNLMVSRLDLAHVNSFDLYASRLRTTFIKEAAAELYIEEAIIKSDLARLLLRLEELQEEQIRQTLNNSQPVVPIMTEEEQAAALELLKDPKLLDRILTDYDTCGLVGEETNKLICYLACVSRHLSQPLAVLIQSSSAAGKTTLMDAALSFMPAEQQIKYSAMTGQSLYYIGAGQLKHKILAIAEEEGVTQASYALKLLQSEGVLSIATAEKDGTTGRQQTQEYQVEGPVMMFLTTTSEHPDPELQNRCVTLHVNEQADQTAAIHQRQRAEYTLQGAQADRLAIRKLHQNAQRLLEPLTVVIPWANQLTFRADRTRMRRDHAKYLSLIAAITLLHQYQRPRSTDTGGGTYIEAILDDIEAANRLANDALGQSLEELRPQTGQLLVLIDDYVTRRGAELKVNRCEIRFTQRGLREAIGWGDFQLRRHLKRLIELEYVLPYHSGQRNQRQYELLYDGQGTDGQPFLLGLIDAAKLSKRKQDVQNDHSEGQNDARSMPSRSGVDGPSMAKKNSATTKRTKRIRSGSAKKPKNEAQAPSKK